MEMAEIRCEDPTGSGLVMEHNMPCPVCLQKKAVISCNTGIFSPCWSCQDEGWEMSQRVVKEPWWKRFLKWVFVGNYEFRLMVRDVYNRY